MASVASHGHVVLASAGQLSADLASTVRAGLGVSFCSVSTVGAYTGTFQSRTITFADSKGSESLLYDLYLTASSGVPWDFLAVLMLCWVGSLGIMGPCRPAADQLNWVWDSMCGIELQPCDETADRQSRAVQMIAQSWRNA